MNQKGLLSTDGMRLYFTPDTLWLTRVLASLPELIVVVDRGGIIQFMNQAEAGYDPTDVVGMDSRALLFPESRDVLDTALDQVFGQQKPTAYEIQAVAADGSPAWYRAEVFPVIHETAAISAIIKAASVTGFQEDLDGSARIPRLLPICAWCGRIETAEHAWEHINAYLKRVGDVDISHTLCPDCEERTFPSKGT